MKPLHKLTPDALHKNQGGSFYVEADRGIRSVSYTHLEMYGSKEKPGKYKKIKGIEHIDKIIDINQAPIGRTPRSNPATYTGVFTHIRDLFSQLPEAKLRGYGKGRFSFNVKGGRCEACNGDGIIKICLLYTSKRQDEPDGSAGQRLY